MSITISFTNDTDQSLVESYDCMFCDRDNASPTCRDCKGKGKVVFYHSRFSMNLANANFATFWNALGLDTEGYTCSPTIILDLLKQFNPELAIRDTIEEKNIIDCGLDESQIDSYVSRLTFIAEAAQRRNEQIVWG